MTDPSYPEMRKLTKTQKRIYRELMKGKWICSSVPGWYWLNRKLKVETEDALRNTGKLISIRLRGRFPHDYVTHCDAIDKFKERRPGTTVESIKPVLIYGEKNGDTAVEEAGKKN